MNIEVYLERSVNQKYVSVRRVKGLFSEKNRWRFDKDNAKDVNSLLERCGGREHMCLLESFLEKDIIQ